MNDFIELTVRPSKTGKPIKTLFQKTDVKRVAGNKQTTIIVTSDKVVFEVSENYEKVKEMLQ